MNTATKTALNEVRRALHLAVNNLTPTDYKDVLEELGVDLAGALEALSEEMAEDE